MTPDAADAEKLQKIGCKTVLDLALLAPRGYEDHSIHTSPITAVPIAFRAKLSGVRQLPGRLLVELYGVDFEEAIEAVYFSPKPFHKAMFVGKEELILYGKLEMFGSKLQCAHPKILSKEGDIEPLYKTALRADVFSRLVKKLVTVEGLLSHGLPRHIAQALFDMHSPKPSDLVDFDERFKLPRRFVEALKFGEIFSHLKALRSKKTTHPAKKLLPRDFESFFSSLPFEATGDQRAAAKEIYADLAKSVQARRVIVGDVGCGKTVVMLCAAYMVYPSRTALMAPTGILASQLFEQAEKLLPPQIKCVLLTQSSQPDDEQLHGAHLIIGTHALLYRQMPPCSLIMIDEQHRFGTKQRQLLSKLTEEGELKPHVLQFSATPIPRTLALIESALVDVTLIRQMPFEKNVATQIVTREIFADLLKHIKSEVEQNRQVAIIYPLVEQSDAIPYQSLQEASDYWQKRFDGVFVTHGKDSEKEQTMQLFRDSGSILLATTVVEVGVSLPKLSTIVIVGAERLGLSTLHQLRGRVARNGLQGYCYLYTNMNQNERLKKFCVTKSGFDIAELDLATRQAGDLVDGVWQSGRSFEYLELSQDERIVEEATKHLSGC